MRMILVLMPLRYPVMRRRALSETKLRRRLDAAGVDPGRNRLAVLGQLAREPNDATAQEIHRRLREDGERIGLATVYRTLHLLEETGVVDALPHSSRGTCYRLCTEGHHHHLVCERCHRVIELTECPAEEWIEKEAARAGFVVTGHDLEVAGLCARCRRRG